MSDTIINWRFGCRHFQIVRTRPFVRFTRNIHHAPGGTFRKDRGWKWFKAY